MNPPDDPVPAPTPETPPKGPSPDKPHVVIVGAGFGGLEAAKALADAPIDLTIVDRSNHHLFQPLLYQVATAGLAPGSIAAPIRSILRDQPNARVILAEVIDIDLEHRTLRLRDDEDHELRYDHLVLAVGGCTSYFGNDRWAPFAPGLKTLDEAIEIRRRVLLAFEQAERENDPLDRAALLTFVVVGAGPTGVEMAGALRELSRFVLARDFRRIHPEATRVLLLEGGPQVLPAFDDALSHKAVEQLAELGVEVRTDAMVTDLDERGVTVGKGDAAEHIAARTIIWAAGIAANPLTARLGVGTDRGGRVKVDRFCALPGRPEVFAIGDMARFEQDGEPLPGVSPVAMQQGRHVARAILADIEGRPREPFRYKDKGSLATIGRSRAVARVGRFSLSGLTAWLTWLAVHLYFLIGFRNRVIVMLNWAWSYATYQRGSRLITGNRLVAGTPRDRAEALRAPDTEPSLPDDVDVEPERPESTTTA